jgi:hypothetical protein
VTFRVLITGIASVAVGGLVIRSLEKLGRFGVILMPAVGLGIGSAVRAAFGTTELWIIPVALSIVFTYAAAMSTHIPSTYRMFRQEFGGTVRVLLSHADSCYRWSRVDNSAISQSSPLPTCRGHFAQWPDATVAACRRPRSRSSPGFFSALEV